MRDRNAFRYIAEDPIVLDLTGCRYGGEVHERIKEAFRIIMERTGMPCGTV